VNVSRALAALVAAVLLTSAAVPVQAADTGKATTLVRITVLDASSKRPVPMAHVHLLGDNATYDGFTDKSGSVTIAVAVRGRYGVRVDADAYAFARDGIVTASGPEAQSVTVVGERTRPARIGTATAKVKASSDTPVATIVDPQSQIAGTVGETLSNNSAIGTNSNGALTIHGHDSSTTAVTLNGAAIFPTNTQNQLGLLSSDVLNAAALSGPTGGAPNGSLNVQTYDPTIDWTGVAQLRGSSFGGNGNALQERGTTGRFGVAAVHSSNETGSPLTGRFFLDTSGQAYSHFSDSTSTGDTFTARYGFDSSHVAYLDLGRLDSLLPSTCAQQFGVLPCGFGPGNYSSSETDYAILRDTLQIDRGQIDVHFFESHSTNFQQFGPNRIPEFAAGTDDRSVTDRLGASGKLSYTFGKKRDVTLEFSSLHDTTSAQDGFSSPLFTVAPQTANTSSVTLGVPIFTASRFGLNLALGSDTSSGVSQGTFDANAHYNVTPRDSLSARFATGHLASIPGTSNSFALPSELEPDCTDGRVLGSGPSLAPAQPGATQNINASFDHSGSRIGYGFNLFQDTSRNANVLAVLPATSVPGFTLAPGYLTSASLAASAACGSAQNVLLSDLFYSVRAPVERQVSSGLDAHVTADIGSRIKLSTSYSFLSARAYGAGLPFAPGSNVIAGLQLPQQPLHKVQFQASAAFSSATSALAAVSYTGANNASMQQGFTRVDLGLRATTKTGDLVFAVQNVGNAAAPLFGGFDGFPNIVTPQTPRTYSVRYRFAIGRRGIDRASMLSNPINFANGLVMISMTGIEPKTEDWLALDSSNSFCGPELVPQAKKYLAAFSAYTDAVHTWSLQGRDLTTAPAFDVDGLRGRVVRGGEDYAIMITFDRTQFRKVNAFTRCARAHGTDVAEAQRLGLYSPSWEERDAIGAAMQLYSPRVGLYFAPQVPNGSRAAGGPFGNIAAPAPLRLQAPANPYAIDEKTCPASYHDAVVSTLVDLRNYITALYAGSHPSAPEGLSIAVHTAKAERWLEIRAATVSFGDAIALCVGATSTDDKALAAIDLNGAPFPSLNYAPKIGFYRIFPAFQGLPRLVPAPAGSAAPKTTTTTNTTTTTSTPPPR
jgi:hypothetical protein